MKSSVTKRAKNAKSRRPNIQTTTTSFTEDGTQVERKAKPTRRTPLGEGKTKKEAPPVVNEAALKEFVKATCETGVKGLIDEFIKIRQETQPCNKPKTGHETNADKNRYKDVYCIEDTRLKLTYPEDGTHDYIHANWVKSATDKYKFICTQGPTEKTVDDFWRMIWQEKAQCILMLCNIMECGKKKCEMYWPENPDTPMTVVGGKITIKSQAAATPEPNIIRTKLTLTETGGGTLEIDHWQWKAWPDRGVPEIPMATFRLLAKIRGGSPLVVHCSAGIGRTGTIVGLDICYTKLINGEKISVDKIVREIRDQRHGSVQTDAQYLFMHRVLLTLAENNKMSMPETAAFIADYDKIMATKQG